MGCVHVNIELDLIIWISCGYFAVFTKCLVSSSIWKAVRKHNVEYQNIRTGTDLGSM